MSAHQRYLPRPSRILLVTVYGDDDHYHINHKMACGHFVCRHNIVEVATLPGLYCLKFWEFFLLQRSICMNLEGAGSSGELLVCMTCMNLEVVVLVTFSM